MGIVPYFPLESGLLTGQVPAGRLSRRIAADEGSPLRKLATEENFAYIERLRRFAEERGHSLLDLAFGWLLAQDGVASVIAGATTPEQVAQNARAGQAWRLTPADLASLPAK